MNESLYFERGINVIVGEPNAGKTVWLKMLDFALGDRGLPEQAFDPDLAEKYDAITVLLEIGDEVVTVERQWKKRGMRSRVSVDGVIMSPDEFSSFLLSKLQMPILHYPKGNPLAERKWPELSFRSLLRHMYRQSRFWSDFADAQPESEQYACLLQMLGIAEKIFSEAYEQLIDKRVSIYRLQGAKDQFVKMLNDVSGDLVDEKEIQLTLTEDSINLAIQRIQQQINSLHERRAYTIESLTRSVVDNKLNGESRDQFEHLGVYWANLREQQDTLRLRLPKTDARLRELQDYYANITTELSKMSRVQSAGLVLADLKITHCPACDRSIDSKNAEPDQCFLCKRPLDVKLDEIESSVKRVDIEIEQLKGEIQEISNLISKFSLEKEEITSVLRRVQEEITRVEHQLQPVRQAAAIILPPEISVIDSDIGRLQERIRQLERIKTLIDYRAKLSEEIDTIQQQVARLQSEVDSLSSGINYERAGDLIEAGMNSYLNSLKSMKLWNQEAVRFLLKERGFDVFVGNGRWDTKLGGTLTIYFLISYHYALLSLTRQGHCHYPGLLIIDFPAKVEDAKYQYDKAQLTDNERFVMKPFKDLLRQSGMETAQIIVAGSSFAGLEGVNRIELEGSWK